MITPAQITISMHPEEALALIIDATEALDAISVAIEDGRCQGGLQAICLALSASAGILDEHLLGGTMACRTRWVAEEGEIN